MGPLNPQIRGPTCTTTLKMLTVQNLETEIAKQKGSSVIFAKVPTLHIFTIQNSGGEGETTERGKVERRREKEKKNQCSFSRSTAVALLKIRIKIYSSMLHTFSKTKVNTHLDTDTFCTLEREGKKPSIFCWG